MIELRMQRGALRLVLLAIAATAELTAQNTAVEANQRVREAIAAEQSGDWAGAAAAYQAALEAGTVRPPRVLAALGNARLRLRQPEQAVQALREAVAADPDLTAARMPLALAWFQLGRYEKAREQLAVLTRNTLSDAAVQHLLGLCLLKLGRSEDGEAALREALRLAPERTEAAYTLATSYAGRGLADEAEAVLDEHAAEEATPQAMLARGAVHKARGELREAARLLDQAIARNPGLPMAYELSGRVRVAMGQLPEAVAAYERELAIDPHNANALAVLGWLYVKANRHNEAAPLLELAVEARPDDAGLLFLLAQVDDARADYAAAAAKLEKVVDARPDDRAAHVLLARAYTKLKKRDEFRREKEIIDWLTQAEQERNLLQGDAYRGPSDTGPGGP